MGGEITMFSIRHQNNSWFFLVVLIMLPVSSCSDRPTEMTAGRERNTRKTSLDQKPTEHRPEDPKISDATPTGTEREEDDSEEPTTKIRPILFVAGYGWDQPGNNHQPFLDRMINDGFPKKDLHLL
jgi:hypothetical protein